MYKANCSCKSSVSISVSYFLQASITYNIRKRLTNVVAIDSGNSAAMIANLDRQHKEKETTNKFKIE